jgi:hypothetical protein
LLNEKEIEDWNSYAIDRLRRYEEDEADPIINVRDVLRQGKNGQYIWELLQNAEDAHATNVRIILTRDSLIFEHDGELTFTFADAKAISKIGFTGKIDKPAIGQFGVGFKSVFKYADIVEIHTEQLNFALENYTKVINNIATPKISRMSSSSTLFRISFKDTEKVTAYSDSKVLLESLNHESVLFLKFLKAITIDIGSAQSSIVKREFPDSLAEIEVKSKETSNRTYWYSKTQSITAELRDGNSDTKGTRETYLGFAFQLESLSAKLEIIAVENSKIFTYFPLADQTSNLKFHIHAPFVINLARTLLDTEEKNAIYNQKLVQFVSMFLVSNLLQLHTEKGLPERILEILPIPSDNVPSIFSSIGKSIHEIFQNNYMIRVTDSVQANPSEVFQANPEIMELIGTSGLAFYNEVANSKFRRTDPGRRSAGKYFLPNARSARVSTFLRHIGVARIDNEKVSEFLSEINYNLRDDNIENNKAEILKNLTTWLNSKNDSAMRNLYEIIANIALQKNKLSNLPIFRTYGEESDSHLRLHEVYLPSSLEQQDSDVLKSTIYYKDYVRSEKLEKLKELFDNLGIEEKDPWVVLRHGIEKETHPKGKAKDLERMDQFLRFYKEDKDRFLRLAKGKIHLVASYPDGKEYWCRPETIFKESKEFPLANLNYMATTAEKLPILWSGYVDSEDFLKMVRDLGVRFRLSTVGEGLELNVSFLETIISSKDLQLIKLLWQFVQTMDYSDFKYQAYRRTELNTKVFRILTESEWIPLANGKFATSYECDPEMLAAGFTEYSGVFFQISDFGRKIMDAKLASEEANTLAKEAGFESAEIMEIAAKLASQYSLDDLRKLDKTDQMNEMQSVKNFEEVVKKSKLQESTSPQISHEKEQIISRTTYEPAQELRKEHLKKLYGDHSGNVSCQMCNLIQMPFKAPRSEDNIEWDYFEAVALLKKYKVESSSNAVALCPTCSAKLKFFRNTDPSLSDRRITAEISRIKNDLDSGLIDSNSEIFFEFTLLNTSHTMKFNKQHLLLLYGLIENIKGNNASD